MAAGRCIGSMSGSLVALAAVKRETRWMDKKRQVLVRPKWGWKCSFGVRMNGRSTNADAS